MGAAGLAGCSSSGGGNGNESGNGNGNGNGNGDGNGNGNGDGGSSNPSTLSAEGSSTVYPISNTGSSYWNSNAPPSDGEYWGSNDESSVPGWDQIETDKNIADYFAGLYGFEETGERSNPPFSTQVALSHSGTGCEAVRDGLVDIGNSSGPITAELDISEEERDENYVDHVVGRDGQPVFVSQEVYDAGVEQLTGEEIRGIYQGDIANWSEVGGPDQEIYVVGRAEGSGTDTTFRLNMLGDADAEMDVDTRLGQNQQVQQVLQDNDNAIGYMALAFAGSGIQAVAIDFDGTVYEPDPDAENTIYDAEYPLNRDLHMYTTITDDTPEGTDMREAAFLNMFLTEFGQQVFVEDENYITLPTSDLEAERDKLPDQV
nr:substrate-binding domain-containing protein [Halopiger xanaduensis]